MRRKLLSSIFVVGILSLFLSASQVIAQEIDIVDLIKQSSTTAASESASTSSQAVEYQPQEEVSTEDELVVVPTRETKINQLADDYRVLLEQYREAEREYFIAKEQYLKLFTLASQETAVNQARQAMLLRIDVLITYISMLSEMLEDTTGIPLENKQPLLVELNILVDELSRHKVETENAVDKVAIDREADSFSVFFPDITAKSYQALAYIRYGRLMTAFDKMQVVYSALSSEIKQSQSSTRVKAEKERGLEEVKRNLEQLNSALAAAKIAVFGKFKPQKKEYLSIEQQLGPVFSLMRLTQSHLLELRN